MKPGMIWRREASYSYQIGAHSVTPIARSIGVRWPRGGLLWQFPVAVEVTSEGDDKPTRLPIPYTTRIIVWSLYVLALVVIIAAWQRRRHTRRTRAGLIHKKG